MPVPWYLLPARNLLGSFSGGGALCRLLPRHLRVTKYAQRAEIVHPAFASALRELGIKRRSITKKNKKKFEYFSSRSPPLKKNKKKQSGKSPPLYLMLYTLVSAYPIVVSRPQIPKICNNLIVTYPSPCIHVYS